MPLQEGVFAIQPEEFTRVVEVWEASVRATHHFVTEANIQFFKPLVRNALPKMAGLACVRDDKGRVAGFIGVASGKVEMLFLDPSCRGQGGGRRLLMWAVTMLGARTVDVNEQNDQAVGFYLRLGFKVAGRSALDGTGKPYPLLHLQLSEEKAKASLIQAAENRH